MLKSHFSYFLKCIAKVENMWQSRGSVIGHTYVLHKLILQWERPSVTLHMPKLTLQSFYLTTYLFKVRSPIWQLILQFIKWIVLKQCLEQSYYRSYRITSINCRTPNFFIPINRLIPISGNIEIRWLNNISIAYTFYRI